MKTLRFILILAFIFTLTVSPAQAQAAERYGFVPLVTEADPNTPLPMQTQQAFERLLPKLLELQKSGAILEFEPELQAGILKIKYAANARTNASAFTAAQEFDDINAAVAMVPQQARTDVQPDALNPEASVPNFKLTLGASCFSGTGLVASSKIIGSLYNQAGALVAKVGNNANSYGNMYACFSWTGSNSNIQPGYKAIYRIYSTVSGALLNTMTTFIPSITLEDTNRADGVVSGTGPANMPYVLTWSHPNLDADRSYTTASVPGKISAKRAWQVDFDNIPLRGRDYLGITVTQNANFSFESSMFVRYSICFLDRNICSIYGGVPNQVISINVLRAGVTTVFSGRTDSSGRSYLEAYDAQNQPFIFAPGDTISITGIPSYRLPKLTAIVDFAKSTVRGIVPANRYFYVAVSDSYTNRRFSKWMLSNPTAAYYYANFQPDFDFNEENGLTVELTDIDPVTGNTTERVLIFGK